MKHTFFPSLLIAFVALLGQTAVAQIAGLVVQRDKSDTKRHG
jgi:hypothetical protein